MPHKCGCAHSMHLLGAELARQQTNMLSAALGCLGDMGSSCN